MKILVACEFSGIVRDAFTRAGHIAYSCDLLPTEQQKGKHILGDVSAVLDQNWDLMIAFPPCTHLAATGARWFAQKRKDGRQQEAVDFFMALVKAAIPRIAVENPVGIMSRVYRKPDQIIQPFWFGHSVQKATCLWLKNLPCLTATKIVDRGPIYVDPRGGKHGGARTMRAKVGYSPLHLLPQSDERWKIRSRTFQGIADAMAEQWG